MDSCHLCKSKLIKKKIPSLYKGLTYLGEFDGMECPNCKFKFFLPEAQEEIVRKARALGIY